MTLQEVMAELEAFGSPAIKKILMNHGAREPLFGVKVGDMKTIQKKIKMDYALSLELFNTNNADAMYFAGLIADDKKMTKADLQSWVERALSSNISEYTVPWVCAGSHHGFEMAMAWIGAEEEHIAAAGWATLSNLVALKPDSELDLAVIKSLFDRIEKNIHTVKDRVRYTMNGFLIAAGTYIASLTDEAQALGARLGTLTVDMQGTACKVPSAVEYLDKVMAKNLVGKKKKTVKC